MKLSLQDATAFKDFLLSLGWEQVPVDRVSGVLKFKQFALGERNYIWVDRFFPDDELTLTSSDKHLDFIQKWHTQKSN